MTVSVRTVNSPCPYPVCHRPAGGSTKTGSGSLKPPYLCYYGVESFDGKIPILLSWLNYHFTPDWVGPHCSAAEQQNQLINSEWNSQHKSLLTILQLNSIRASNFSITDWIRVFFVLPVKWKSYRVIWSMFLFVGLPLWW